MKKTGEMTGESARTLLTEAERLLAGSGVPDARREAARLLGWAWKRPWLEVHAAREEVPEEAAQAFREGISRRSAREPLEYVTRRCAFRKSEFLVGPDVLIPRPDTETLVEWALEFLAGRPAPRVLELCTGSGAVILSVAREIPDPAARFYATDISHAALGLARKNAVRTGLSSRVSFHEGDLFAALPPGTEPFDLVIANPPYVASGEIPGLQPEVARFEPRLALDGGADGFDFYPRIIVEAHSFLRPGGMLLLESDGPLVARTAELMRARGFEAVSVRNDFAGKPRAAAGYHTGKPVPAPDERDILTVHG